MTLVKQDNPVQGSSITYRLALLGRSPTFCLFFFFSFFYYFTNAGWYKEGDESAHLAVARNMVRNGAIGLVMDESAGEGPGGEDLVRGRDGLWHFKWGIGQSLVEVPFYFAYRVVTTLFPPGIGAAAVDPVKDTISEMVFLFLCPSIFSALGCSLVYALGVRLGYRPCVSILLSLAYGLGTMAWPYSKSLMSDTTLNVAILGAVYCSVSYVALRRKYWLLGSGALMGLALIVKPMSAIVSPALMAYVLGSARSKRAAIPILLCFCLPLAACAGFQLWYNDLRYGDVFQFGYEKGWGALGFCTPLDVGLYGLFLSPGKGFFLYNPVAILGLVKAGEFFRARKGEALLFLGITVSYALPHALWCLWHGDWAWGPRFLLVIVPYFILFSGAVFERWSMRPAFARTTIVSLCIISVGIQVLGVAIHPFSFPRARWEVISQLTGLNDHDRTYRRASVESAFAHFNPTFSHVLGNWWLLKHMVFSYDLCSDVPWREMGDMGRAPPTWVKGDRTVPFWWPVAFPMRSPLSSSWVLALAAADLLLVCWWALRLRRVFRSLS